MKKIFAIPGLAALGWLSLGWAASEFDMDLMQTVEDTAKDLVSNLSLADGPAAKANIADLDAMLAQVEDHYAQKGDAADAAAIAHDGRSLLGDIGRFVEAGDFDAANAKNSEFSKTCKSCHKVYKKS
ncbi:hypothetical protein D0B54_07135 [Solimonas sp. K1W22B-7]|uniref:hypothetical protein n=1 Tax=Solimonas sp. K1W22B-7 TaxID=2303331 RepID=UPI000E336CA7|nr:hypothetical protein [Solimonas sp. K1W22B-7]AXQ28470.1 hypothetical protein D0B54_07135 [Solimonas sp. K1W22B-7]